MHDLRLHEHWICVAAAVEAEVCTTCPYVARRFGRCGHDGCLSHLLFHFACWILGTAQFPADQADHPGAVIIAIMTTNI